MGSSSRDGDSPPKRPPLSRRLLLSAGTFSLSLLVLELLTRACSAPPAPVLLRDSLFVSQLELPHLGGSHDTAAWRLDGRPPLAEGKRPDEVRVFVFGESSVQGVPWNYPGSPVTMLHDQLRARFPSRDITVVNMGRGAANTADVYYLLLSVERFAPDYVIFYMGANDHYDSPEMCGPVNHPVFHRAWRWAAAHSRLAWALRVLAPPRISGRLSWVQNGSHRDLCDQAAGFQAWTDILVDAALRSGAQVLVTTPVEDALAWVPCDETGCTLEGQAQARGAYRLILACLLDETCDLNAFWRAHATEQRDEQGWFYRVCDETGTCQLLGSSWLHGRAEAWRLSATRRRAHLVDFLGQLERQHSLLLPPLFIDQLHLSLEGYWLLASRWVNALGPLLESGPTVAQPADPDPPPFDRRGYLPAILRDSSVEDGACLLIRAARGCFLARMPLIGTYMLRAATEIDEPVAGTAPSRARATAQVLLGWLRRQIGAEPRLPPDLAPAIDRVDWTDLDRQLSRRDCSGVGWTQ